MRQVRRREGVEEAAEGMRRLARVRVRFGELGFGVFGPEAELTCVFGQYRAWHGVTWAFGGVGYLSVLQYYNCVVHFVLLLRLRVAVNIDVERFLALGRFGFVVEQPLLVDCFACADSGGNARECQEVQHVQVLGYRQVSFSRLSAGNKDMVCSVFVSIHAVFGRLACVRRSDAVIGRKCGARLPVSCCSSTASCHCTTPPLHLPMILLTASHILIHDSTPIRSLTNSITILPRHRYPHSHQHNTNESISRHVTPTP
jgi:hypothetical protein